MSTSVRRLGKVLRNVDFESDCWIWRGELRQGYGYHGGSPAHRVVFELLRGPIPEGLELDHLCRTPACVFPDHLEPVTRDENARRRNLAKAECKNGHAFTSENTYVNTSQGKPRRTCRTCQRETVRRYRERSVTE